MRNEFVNAIINNYEKNNNQIFITGDLGFMALEPLVDILKNKFINGGISEQNIVSMAAALAYDGFIPWVYSISSFITLRPYEQIRNDVCHHNLPVKIVGNGGGYGYGIMGSTHHNLEDIGIMRVLPNMKIYIPYNSSDLDECVSLMINDDSPNYLRLNSEPKINNVKEKFTTWRNIKAGNKVVVIGIGPILGNLFELEDNLLSELDIWALGILPITYLPQILVERIKKTQSVIIIEEHNSNCGLNELIAKLLLTAGINIVKFKSIASKGYQNGLYGSHKWHLTENGLAGKNLEKEILDFIKIL
jgi:transketolase